MGFFETFSTGTGILTKKVGWEWIEPLPFRILMIIFNYKYKGYRMFY